jgi:plasmid stabilization system protein ParE
MTFAFLRAAEEELAEAVAYYNREGEGLGFELAAEVQRTLARIAGHPTAWPALSKRTRRCRTNRFPYGVLYQTRGNLILVVAVMHLRRHPDSWKGRLARRER